MPMLARVVSFVAAAGTLDSSLAVRPAKDLDLAAVSEDLDLAAVSENDDERNDVDIPAPSSFFPTGRDSIFILKADALASEAQQFGFPLGATAPTGSVKVHLAEDTAEDCDYGITFTETECKTIGTEVLAGLKISPARSGMISTQADDAPPGCSLMTGTDWAVTYNTNTKGKNSAKKYSLLCHGERKAAHPVKEGKSECDFGKAITKVTDCLESVSQVHNKLLGRQPTDGNYIVQTEINVGKWPSLPPGCSLRMGKTGVFKLRKVASGSFAQSHDDDEAPTGFDRIGQGSCLHAGGWWSNKTTLPSCVPLQQCAQACLEDSECPAFVWSAQPLFDGGGCKSLGLPKCARYVGNEMVTGTSTEAGSAGRTCFAKQVAWFNNDPEGKNDGTYVEICTGTPVP